MYTLFPLTLKIPNSLMKELRFIDNKKLYFNSKFIQN